jgi:hypothetical protein
MDGRGRGDHGENPVEEGEERVGRKVTEASEEELGHGDQPSYTRRPPDDHPEEGQPRTAKEEDEASLQRRGKSYE